MQIYKDNTYSARASHETEKLQTRVDELETTNEKLVGKVESLENQLLNFM